MTKRAIIDVPELMRFILTGITATIGNIAAVWLALFFVPFKIALLAGIVAGLTISFTLSKFFAFQTKSLKRVGREATRFLMVYAVGSICYWSIAVVIRHFALAYGAPPKVAEIGGAFIGAGTMLLTSYLGHRFFTYQSHQCAAGHGDKLPWGKNKQEEARSPKGPNPIHWGMLIATLVISFVVILLAMPRDMNMFDEGIILSNALRILNGEIIHRDFYSCYGPGQYYAVAALFKLFGNSFIAARLYDLVIRAAILTAVFYIIRRESSVFLALAFTAIGGMWFMSIGSPLYPVFPCIFFSLIGSYLVLRAGEGTNVLPMIAGAGVLTGVTALFRYDAGFFLLTAHIFSMGALIWLSDPRNTRLRRMLIATVVYGGGTAIVFIPAAVLFLLHAPINAFIADIIDYHIKYYPVMRGLPFPGLPAIWSNLADGAVYLPLIATLLALVELARISLRRWSNSFPSLRTTDEDRVGAYLVVFGSTAFILFFKGWVRVSPLHMMLGIVPALIVFAIVIELWWHRGRGMRTAAVVLLLLVMLPAWTQTKSELKQSVAIADRSIAGWLALRTGIITPPAAQEQCETGPASGIARLSSDYARITNYLDTYTRPDERIFAAAGRHDKILLNSVSLYFIAGRLPGTHWYQFDPGLVSRADIQTEIIGDLQRNHVRWVVRDANFDDVMEPNGSAQSSGVTLLDQYLDKNYRPVAFSGKVKVLLANDTKPVALRSLDKCEPTLMP
jgi:putative flippase GtrA